MQLISSRFFAWLINSEAKSFLNPPSPRLTPQYKFFEKTLCFILLSHSVCGVILVIFYRNIPLNCFVFFFRSPPIAACTSSFLFNFLLRLTFKSIYVFLNKNLGLLCFRKSFNPTNMWTYSEQKCSTHSELNVIGMLIPSMRVPHTGVVYSRLREVL